MVKLYHRPTRLTHHGTTMERRTEGRSSNSNSRRQLWGRLFTGGIYTMIALFLTGWYSLFHRNTKDFITGDVIESSKEKMSLLPPQSSGTPIAGIVNHSSSDNNDNSVARMDHNTVLMTRPQKPIVVAYAISLIKVSFSFFMPSHGFITTTIDLIITHFLDIDSNYSHHSLLLHTTVWGLPIHRRRTRRCRHRLASFDPRNVVSRGEIPLRLQDVRHRRNGGARVWSCFGGHWLHRAGARRPSPKTRNPRHVPKGQHPQGVVLWTHRIHQIVRLHIGRTGGCSRRH